MDMVGDTHRREYKLKEILGKPEGKKSLGR
jgi:hypothetical protein